MVGSLLLLQLLRYRQRKRNKYSKNNFSNKDFAKPFVKQEFRKVFIKKESKENEERLQSCRVCLKEGSIPLFGDDSPENLSKDLSTIASIDIDPLDEFPKYLCQSCHSLLQAAVTLRKTAQQSDIILRNANVVEATDLDHNHDESLNDYVPIYKSQEEKEKNLEIFHCNECNLHFKSFTAYFNHRMTKKHEMMKSQCPYCQKLFMTTYLNQHISTFHKPKTTYMCEFCGKTFICKQQFTRHRLTHFYSVPYKCTLCPYRGRFRQCLKMHMRTHTGEKPYQCSECPSRFISKCNLIKHTRVHKAERDFKCETCGRGFHSKRDLGLHLKVYHTGIREHICNVCGKAFGYRKNMLQHQRKIHKREKHRKGVMPIYLQAAAKNIAIEDS